ncbi:putative lipoprotein [Myxococcus stipitatus DSM 14675]|uniref:Putative lipoprotein n=1 Tax=Myxococcus stipitatus (strain DSM 14675 / JCM 12634 / Mx s8) TaxID=1278073 RepID=L7U4Q9_MYXSD|nr:hypothetical protein [Myxococcus stipitatus]AGC42835.1 putative lipoprotein [Myxococcus stipitatus DSM 14675]
MKKLMFGLMAAGSLMFGAGCGGNACDALDEAHRGLSKKVESCGNTSDEGDETSGFDKNVCENALDHCSAQEKDRLNEVADCLKDLPNCEAGGELDWIDLFSACFDKAAELNPDCAEAAK